MGATYKTLPAAAAANAPLAQIQALLAQGCDVNAVDATDQFTALHFAAFKGNVAVVTCLLDAGAKTNVCSKSGSTPLHRAAAAGNGAVMRLLVARGADPYAVTTGGLSMLATAAFTGKLDAVRAALAFGVNVDMPSNYGKTPLHVAAEAGHIAVMRVLVDAGANVHATAENGASIIHEAASKGQLEEVQYGLDLGIDPNAVKQDGMSLLHVASYNGRIAVMELLAERGANVNAVTKLGSPITYTAAGQGHLEAVKWGLDKGVNIEATTEGGYTALLSAAEKGRVEVMRLLAARGADIHARTKTGRSLLYCAIFSGSMEAIRYAIDLGVDLTTTIYETGHTALFGATIKGNVAAMKLLIESGLDPKTLTKNGSSLLYMATGNGQIEAIKYLVELGFDPSIARNDGSTPLHFAADQGRTAPMRVLVGLGANIHAKTKSGWSVIYSAAGKGVSESVKCGLDLGVDPNAARNDGFSPLHNASYFGKVDVMELLAERGANVSIVTKLNSTITHTAAGQGQLEAVKWGLDKGISIEATTQSGYTALLFAAEKGHVEVMRLLVERGADIHARTKTGRSVLYSAVLSGSLEAIRYAIDLGVDLTTTIYETGFNALHCAAFKGNVAAMKLLIECGMDSKAVLPNGSSILYVAAGYGQIEAIQFAMDLGFDPSIARNDGSTPLHYAADQSRTSAMRLLVGLGANIHAKTKLGSSVIYNAAGKGELEGVKCGLDLGIDPNAARNDGLTPLYNASDNGKIDVMELLVERGANVKVLTKLGSPIIFGAAGKGQLESVKWGLDRGVDVNTTNNNGYSTLLFAAQKGQVEAMRLLMERGANVEARAKNGRSLVFCATVSGNVDAVRLALDSGVAIDHTVTETGFTALHHAAQEGNLAIMQLLVDRGANLQAVATDGSTVLDIALRNDKTDAAKLAIDSGAAIPETSEDGWSAFHAAAKKGDAAMMKMYIDRGGKGDALTKGGRTALHVAALEGKLEAVKFAADLGLSIMEGDANGYTPLHCAAKSGSVEVINFLVERGANIQAKAERHISVLHSAVRSEKVEAVGRLLDLGVAATSVDQDGGSALHYATEIGAVEIMKLLVEHGAAVDTRTKSGRTILHSAVVKTQLAALQYALELTAVDVNASTKVEWETPLYLTTQVEDHKIALLLAFELCSHGALWTPACQQRVAEQAMPKVDGKEKDTPEQQAAQWLTGLVACISHWVRGHRMESHVVAEIPVEVVERGAESVKTYVNDVAKSDANELVYRCKVCVLGPTGWGKTSLIRSLESMQPTLTKQEDVTADSIELMTSAFVEKRAGKPARRLDVTFWDFPGQDVHQLAHSLFFSRRTLFVVVIDLPEYVSQLNNADGLSDDQFEFAMDRFLNTRVFRWLRTILSQQPDAHVLLAGTKEDSLEDPTQAREVWIDLKDRLEDWKRSYVDELQAQLRTASDANHGTMHRTPSFLLDQDDQSAAMFDKLKKKLAGVGEWLVVSSADADSIAHARQKVQGLLTEAELGFPMWKTYTQVHEAIKKRCVDAKKSGGERGYLDATIVRLSVLRRQLMREIDGLEREDCEQIVRALDDLGDVLWFEHEDAGELNDYVILDPKLGIDIVSEVINHDFSKDPKGPPQDGLIRHSRLCTFPWWREMDMVLTHSFKALLQYFHLAFPAENEEMLPESDIIVPSFWKTFPSASSRSLVRQQSKLDYIPKNRFCWEYEVPAGVASSIYEQLAVQTSTSYLKRVISADCVECACDEFASRITRMEGEGKTDVIRIEVAGEGAEMSWHNMRFYLMKMEKVLEGYPGMTSWRYVVDTARGQLVESRYALEPAVKKLVDAIALGRDEQHLRVDIPWFPSDMNWYIRKSWKDIGTFQQLQLDQLVRDKVEVLRKLAIAGDAPRRYPALWSFEYLKSERKVILRMSSDLSGRCFHVPIEIEANPEFLGKYGGVIKEGLSVCSGIVASAIPLPFIQNVIDAAMSVYDTKVEQTKQVHSLIDRMDMSEMNQFDSRTTALSPGAATAVLRDVLKFYNDSFDDLEISDLTNLELAVTSTGEYVWAHAHEIAMLKDKITRCASPPSTWADIEEPNPVEPESPPEPTESPSESAFPSTTEAAGSSSLAAAPRKSIASNLPKTKISFCISSVTGLSSSDWYKVYCKWQISYGKSLAPLAIGVTDPNMDSSLPPTWSDTKISLETITSVEMLRECRLLVRVKRRSRLGWAKLLGGREVLLRDYIDGDAVQNFHCDPIDVAMDDALPPKQWATVEFLVDQ